MQKKRIAGLIGAAFLLCAGVAVASERSDTVNDQALQSEIRQDIVDLHDFFVGWYNGELPQEAYDSEFDARLGPAFTIVLPSGVELDRDSLSGAMRESFGKNPGFQIEIRNVRLVHATKSMAVATYEEWQRKDEGGPESVSGRLSTVVLARGEILQWLHVHETWLPDVPNAN